MKKTLTINLSGSVFHIDDDAYEKLSAYLSKINRHFGNDADAKEIVEDIEARISEIFSEKIKNGAEVINIAHVEEIIVIMGTPEAISNEEEEKEKVSEKRTFRIRGKRLYRDPENRVLGGVCSGLGAYFSVDPVLIRILFVLVFFFPIGSSVLIYLILWIVVPKAASTAQRLEMKGEEVNIDNISKSIKEEMQDVKENFRNYRTNPAYTQSRSGMHEVGNALAAIFKVIGTILLVIIGIPFVIIGLVALVVLFSLLFASHQVLSMTPFEGGFDHLNLLFAQGSTLSWIWIGLLLVVSIPLVMLVYGGIKMIFRFKSPSHIFGSVLAGLFVIGIFILLINGSRTLGEFSKAATVTNHETVASRSDTLYITARQLQSEKDLDALIDPDFNFDHFKIGTLNGKEVLIGSPELRIEKGDDSQFNLVINKISRGFNLSKAKENADDIPFKYQVKDSLVNLQPSFLLPGTWRNQRIKLKINVPVGKTIYLDESLKNIVWDVKNTSDTYDYDMVNKYWTMKSDGLTLVNRAVTNVKSLKK
jgi:phage shock protein PspC (stress-responsive transcriptional regulator)